MLYFTRQLKSLFMGFVVSYFAEIPVGNSVSAEADNSSEGSPEVAEVKKEVMADLNDLKSTVEYQEALLKIDLINLDTVNGLLSSPVNKESKNFQREGAQRVLFLLGYNIDFKKNGKLVQGEEAIDGKLGNAYREAMENLQVDLGVNQTLELDEATIAALKEKIQPVLRQKWKEHRNEYNAKYGKTKFSSLPSVENQEGLNDLMAVLNTKGITQENIDSFTEDEILIASFDKKVDINNNDKVVLLQEALLRTGRYSSGTDKLKGENDGADGQFGNSTIIALGKEETLIRAKVKELQTTVDSQESLNTEIPTRHSNSEAVKAQVKATERSIKELDRRLEITAMLNGKLSDYFFRENSGYSIEEGLRIIFKKDKYDQIHEDIISRQEYYNNLMQEGGKDRLNNAIIFLSDYEEFDGEGFEAAVERNRKEQILDHAGKALPWLAGVYLGDIPLSFIKSLTGGANIDKSVAFKDWVASGMKGEFKEYYESKKNNVNVIQNQYSLRGLLTTLQVPKEDLNHFDNLGIDGLTTKTKELLRKYIQIRLIPDLEILDKESFGFFDWLFDKKEDQSDELLEEISILSKEDNINFEEISKKVIELISLFNEEGDVTQNVIEPISNRQSYFKEVMSQNRVFETISYLYSLDGDSSSASILFYLDDIKDFDQLGLGIKDKEKIKELYIAIEKRDDENVVKLTTELKDILNSLFSNTPNTQYLINQIPKIDGLDYVKVGNARHGESLLGMTNLEAFEKATSETPEKDSQMSQLGFAYRSLVEKGEIYGISYEEYEEAFKNKDDINIDEILNDPIIDNPIINTGREEGMETLSTFKELKDGRGDTTIFRLAPITKKYTYYSDGQKITQSVTYNLYMRPDCGNPLLVPGSINTVSTPVVPGLNASGKSITEFDPRTMALVDGYFPVVIPWWLLNNLGGGGNGGNDGLFSKPGENESDIVDEVIQGVGGAGDSGVTNVTGGIGG